MKNSMKLAAKTNIDVISEWQIAFIERIETDCRSRKQEFGYNDAIKQKSSHTKRDMCFMDALKFLNSNPLQNNDYFKYVSCYIEEDKKLILKYFRHNVEKLNGYYAKVDEAKEKGIRYNPFGKLAYSNYVIYMILKLKGQYIDSDDMLFNVKVIGNREYNPLTYIPSVLRGELPFRVKEYDIKRAFPTFIDIELNTNHRETIYELLPKEKFSIFLNANASNPKNNIESCQKSLNVVYGSNDIKVLTIDRFNNKGKAFSDFTKYEKEYIERFVTDNNLFYYVRLHDGIFVLQDVECKKVKFGIVEFAIKKCIKPLVENHCVNFYSIVNGKIETSRDLYSKFFIQEKIKRIFTNEDKIQLLVDTNNVVDFFNYRTEIVSFLECNINESSEICKELREIIAKESKTVIYDCYQLLHSSKLYYYSDTKTSFGLPFKNGFYYFDLASGDNEIKRKEYTDVQGFFSPHKIQTRLFKYTDEIGMFEQFLTRAATGRETANSKDTININKEFCTMFGYLCHTYKSQTNSPCIVLTDEDANDENRNGGRGKTVLTKGINEVQNQLWKGGKEFNPNYSFVFDDLDKKHKSYVIDDVPAGFKYDDLYTNILGDINCHRKGKTAESIPFSESPKFIVTTNWVFRFDEKNASTNRRFLEYKFSNYYNQSHSPKDDFGVTFFEEWDDEEWSKFYSFVFRCVKQFLNEGITQIPYNKANDNYLAIFNNVSMSEEFERIITILISDDNSFSVNDFLRKYNTPDNPLRVERAFHFKNVKKFIDVWFIKNAKDESINKWTYQTSKKKWVKRNKE